MVADAIGVCSWSKARIYADCGMAGSQLTMNYSFYGIVTRIQSISGAMLFYI